MKKAKIDELYAEFRDLLQECPEAEHAIRDYRRQSMDAAVGRMRENDLRCQEEAWQALRDQLRASGMSVSDSIH